MRIAIVTDAWYPQVNGVVRTLDTVRRQLLKWGHEVVVFGPHQHFTIPCPTYPEIRLALGSSWRLHGLLDALAPDCIHIATEGPLGWSARQYALKNDFPFTTSFHTRFPEYVQARTGIPPRFVYSYLRRFHDPAANVMVTTPSMEQNLRVYGFQRLALWSRGVDTRHFHPGRRTALPGQGPHLVCVGRVAVEKNIEAFLNLDMAGTKHVIGDGPQLNELKSRYPGVHFAGALFGEELARVYASADVFVFPSRTDTFGLVILEALASGTPVAAFPVPGPLDILGSRRDVGCLSENLSQAVAAAQSCDRGQCRDFALTYSWEASAQQFLENLRPIPRVRARAVSRVKEAWSSMTRKIQTSPLWV